MNLPKSIIAILCSSCFYSFVSGQDFLAKGDHFAPVNGIEIHYYVTGEGPVCLVPTPGWGPSMSYLKNSLQYFENFFTVVYYDTRISGQSTGPDDSTKYTSDDLMSDMDALRVYLKQPKVWIMGHSAGGFQVLNYGIHHNEKLKGIIAIDAIVGRDSLYDVESTKMIMKRKGQPYFEKGAAVLLGTDTTNYSLSAFLEIILPFYFHDISNMQSFLQLKGVAEISDKAWAYTRASKMGTEYLFPELKKIKVPVLVIVGDDDFICDKISQSDRIVKNIPSATELVIKDAGHFPWAEQPDEFDNGCVAWLKKQKLKE